MCYQKGGTDGRVLSVKKKRPRALHQQGDGLQLEGPSTNPEPLTYRVQQGHKSYFYVRVLTSV